MQALIYGGSGALGRAMVKQFTKTWNVTSIDHHENPEIKNNIILDPKFSPNQQLQYIQSQLSDNKFNCIVCVAGGWQGGSIKDPDFLDVYESMHAKSVIPSLISCHLASKYSNKGGLIILTGASSVFSGPTPGMIGYALAKTAVHTLAMNMFGEYLPQDGAIVTIMPETIDTPSNREAMPTADYTKWANPNQISELVRSWAEGLNRPISGSMAHLRMKNGVVVPEFV